MYRRLSVPDGEAIWDNEAPLSEYGDPFHPIVTLADEYGGRAQITIDDHCLVLLLKQENGRYKPTPWWFKEATASVVALLSERLERAERFADLLIPG